MSLTDALLAPLLIGDPTRPLITYYDDATGERVELSVATLANWAAKTANLLRDECDVAPGTAVGMLLPAHWQTAAVLLGAWWCGAHVVADPAQADVVLADERALAAVRGAPVLLGLTLDAFGRGLAEPPPGVIDYATEVRVHGDEFVPTEAVAGSAPALAGAGVDETLAAARSQATALGLAAGDRVLSTVDWPVPAGVLDGLLAVLAVRGSLVQCRHADEAALARRAETERVTARLR